MDRRAELLIWGLTALAALTVLGSQAWGEPSPYVPQYFPRQPIVVRPYQPGGEWQQPKAEPGQVQESPTWNLTPPAVLDPYLLEPHGQDTNER